MDVVVQRKIPSFRRESNPRTVVVQTLALLKVGLDIYFFLIKFGGHFFISFVSIVKFSARK
jgi:hypothetical protein